MVVTPVVAVTVGPRSAIELGLELAIELIGAAAGFMPTMKLPTVSKLGAGKNDFI